MAKKKFVCSICGHVHEGNSAPDTCPVCQASSLAFTEDRSGRKKGWMHNPNSNTYIIVYSTVMVVIVATLLAVASLSLQKRQAENELQEKKSNILQSLGYSPDENPQEFDRALADFDNQVKSFVLDADGVKTGCAVQYIDLSQLPDRNPSFDLFVEQCVVTDQDRR